MGWVKRALISSVIWLVFLAILLFGAAVYINIHPPAGLTDFQISKKFGEMFGIGIFLGVLIWVYEFKKKKRT